MEYRKVTAEELLIESIGDNGAEFQFPHAAISNCQTRGWIMRRDMPNSDRYFWVLTKQGLEILEPIMSWIRNTPTFFKWIDGEQKNMSRQKDYWIFDSKQGAVLVKGVEIIYPGFNEFDFFAYWNNDLNQAQIHESSTGAILAGKIGEELVKAEGDHFPKAFENGQLIIKTVGNKRLREFVNKVKAFYKAKGFKLPPFVRPEEVKSEKV